MSRRKYSGKKTVNTHAHLAHAARHLVELSESQREGSYYTSMMALVATAFMLEALLNYLGCEQFESWDALERLGPRKKLESLAEKLRISFDLGTPPYQSFSILFGVRNALAHGRSEIVCGTWPETSKHRSPVEALETEWERYCEAEHARKHYEAACEIASHLWGAAGNAHGPFTYLSRGIATSSA